MNIQIPVVSIQDRWQKWLTFISPITKVTLETDIKLLSAYLVLYNKYSSYKSDNLYSLLFSPETTKIICTNLGISEKSYKKSFERLTQKEIIKDNKINQKILYPIITQDYTIKISFNETKI